MGELSLYYAITFVPGLAVAPAAVPKRFLNLAGKSVSSYTNPNIVTSQVPLPGCACVRCCSSLCSSSRARVHVHTIEYMHEPVHIYENRTLAGPELVSAAQHMASAGSDVNADARDAGR